jgi:hypothetical protein
VRSNPTEKPIRPSWAEVQQRVRRAGAVGAHQDLLVRGDALGQLLERGLKHGDLVLRAVSAGVARPQHAGERVLGAVEVGEHRVKPERALVVAGGPGLVGVDDDQRRVEIDDHQPRPRAAPPRTRPGLCARRPDSLQRVRITRDPLQQPVRRRVRGDLAEQRLLIAHRAQIAQRVAAVGQHHRQIPDHAPRRVPRRALKQTLKRAIERAREPEAIRDAGQQHRARVRDQTLSVRPDLYLHIAPHRASPAR